jgi:hypothetical protein
MILTCFSQFINISMVRPANEDAAEKVLIFSMDHRDTIATCHVAEFSFRGSFFELMYSRPSRQVAVTCVM